MRNISRWQLRQSSRKLLRDAVPRTPSGALSGLYKYSIYGGTIEIVILKTSAKKTSWSSHISLVEQVAFCFCHRGSKKEWLFAFVIEAQRKDGKKYPPTTLNQLLAEVWQYACTRSQDCPKFLDKHERKFDQLNQTLQSVFRELREEGVGAVVKHAHVILPEKEVMLWRMKTIGDHSPVTLQRAVFYYVGKVFCLQGGDE